jgi:hypothetical protein
MSMIDSLDGEPLPLLCVGVPRSATTWLFNVVIEILKAGHPTRAVKGIFSDQINDPVEEKSKDCILVIKSHMPDASIRFLVAVGGISTFVTVRNPYDTIASLVERFEFSFEQALEAVHESCLRISRIISHPNCLVFRYEEGFFANRDTLDAIANKLGLEISDSDRDRIFQAFTMEAVKFKLEEMLVNGKFEGKSSVKETDEATQWHFNHLGDGRVGKSTNYLSEAEIAVSGYRLRDVAALLGYLPVDVPPLLERDRKLRFGLDGVGASCLGVGFGAIEEWGVWLIGYQARLKIDIEQDENSTINLVLSCRLGPSFYSPDSASECEIRINDERRMIIRGDQDGSEYLKLAFSLPNRTGSRQTLDVKFLSTGLKSPRELDIASDDRLLGIGLIAFEIL